MLSGLGRCLARGIPGVGQDRVALSSSAGVTVQSHQHQSGLGGCSGQEAFCLFLWPKLVQVRGLLVLTLQGGSLGVLEPACGGIGGSFGSPNAVLSPVRAVCRPLFGCSEDIHTLGRFPVCIVRGLAAQSDHREGECISYCHPCVTHVKEPQGVHPGTGFLSPSTGHSFSRLLTCLFLTQALRKIQLFSFYQ